MTSQSQIREIQNVQKELEEMEVKGAFSSQINLEMELLIEYSEEKDVDHCFSTQVDREMEALVQVSITEIIIQNLIVRRKWG